MSIRGQIFAACGLLFLAHGVLAAPPVYEYGDNYGTVNADLKGLGGAANGWYGAWTCSNATGWVNYVANHQLTYTDANYVNGGESGANDGCIGLGSSSYQNLRRTVANPMTGTIWISALVYQHDYAGVYDRNYIMLNPTSDSDTVHFFGLQDLHVRLDYGADEWYGGPALSDFNDRTGLLLAKIEMNVGGPTGTWDAIKVWANPTLSGGEAGLGTPSWTHAATADAYGPELTYIGVVVYGASSYIDTIRVSNTATGLRDVLGLAANIPEPSALALLLGGLALLAARRR